MVVVAVGLTVSTGIWLGAACGMGIGAAMVAVSRRAQGEFRPSVSKTLLLWKLHYQ
jgi:hypothetical protein